MSLPKLNVPKYKHHLVGINKDIDYRPFTVREQKILLAAKESDDEEQVVQAIEQILELCTFKQVNIKELPFFDFEDLFVRIRAKSVSEIVEFDYQTKDTKEKVHVEIDLNDVKVKQDENHSKIIMVDGSIGIKMSYPSIVSLTSSKDEIELLKKSIESVFEGEDVYNLSEFSQEEVDEFIDSLDMGTMNKIKEFFETMPRLKHSVEVELPDGSTTTLNFKGMSDFF